MFPTFVSEYVDTFFACHGVTFIVTIAVGEQGWAKLIELEGDYSQLIRNKLE
jgi:hypothetical protein